MIARILGGLSIGLAMLAVAQTINLARSDHELKATRAILTQAQSSLKSEAARVAMSESARQAEREQCAQDFAGEVERAKVEAERAAKSASAIATLTKNCAFDRGQPAVNRALRDVLGEGK
jgi:hypothetical protein